MGRAGDMHDDMHDDDEHPDEGEPIDEHPDEEPDRPRGSPPDPLDRLWRHPTELPVATPVPARRSVSGWAIAIAAGAAGAVITVVALAAAGSFDDSSTPAAQTPFGSNQGARRVAAAEIAADVGESVVSVVAHTSQGVRRGSGVCVRHEGDILTSASLIGDATRVDVTTSEGTTASARITGRDTTTDLALLSIESGVSAADLADDDLFAGSSVWIVAAPAVGSSSPWMSGGMVATADALVARVAGPTTAGLVETDAVANDAAVGGALVDPSGAVAGIVLGPIDNSRTTFAVPIAMAVGVADDIRRNGAASHGSLGVEGVDGPGGPTVTQLRPDGAAADAGIRTGDVFTHVDNHRVMSMAEVMAIVRGYQPGDGVVVELLRGDQALEMEVELQDLNPPPPAQGTTTTAAPAPE
jgi:S1-C subfamily serine protease